MYIDRSYIEGTVNNLRADVLRMDGAIRLCEEMLRHLDAQPEPTMTVDELSQAIERGAESGSSET